MESNRLLVANRGEIAIRVCRAAAELGWHTVGIYSEDDARSLHVRRADDARALQGRGASAYLDLEQLLGIARETGCGFLHPGYGFLSESSALSSACEQAGVSFVGPRPQTLELFGDKLAARDYARECGVPVLRGTPSATSLGAAGEFLASLAPGESAMIKAVAGGGGRGMRAVSSADELEAAFERCASEAESFFGDGALYLEKRVVQARHLEVQIAGDGSGNVIHLYERECTLQRRHQKLVEIARSPNLASATRDALTSAATLLAGSAAYRGLGTFEFLLDVSSGEGPEALAFIEANPRLQVEHTVTEMVTGVDLVKLQLRVAAGASLDDLSLSQSRISARGHAIQARVNMERVDKKGRLLPSGGTLAIFEAPSGPGVRTDTFGYAGYETSPSFDSLLAKVIVHSDSPHFGDAVRKLHRALREFRIEGVQTNLGFLQRLLEHPDVVANDVTTDFVTEHMAELAAEAPGAPGDSSRGPALAGSRIDRNNPLAVLEHGKGETEAPVAADPQQPALPAVHAGPPGTVAVEAPLQGTIVSIDVESGAAVSVGHPLLVMEAMKMEHVIAAERSGIVRQIAVSEGDAVFAGHPLVYIEERAVDVEQGAATEEVDLDHVRADLAEVIERHEIGLDEARPEAVARRRKTGQRTARENIADLCDPGTYIEYGPLVIAAQRRRRTVEDLVRNTPADGMLAGIGAVNGDRFTDQDARCVLMSYDYTVLAGTQGGQNHRKKDRLFELAEQWRLPVVFFTEGGGGRPGDTDGLGTIGLDCLAFQYFGRLSGLVPLIGINSGRCFAGNAALLGCCDVVIATENSNIGMGGPAMIEGGGLGIFRPEEVGPIDVQRRNGVVDIVATDEAEAVAFAKQYLSYFQGSLAEWECADQRRLRSVIPENRLRIYDVRKVIEILSDTGSVLELRRDFGLGMVTSLVRIEGRPVGIIANNPTHLAGAIDSDAADKASRFMQLCDAFDIPLLFLCDTPGIMVGPEVEQTALVRHAARMFVTGASISVPFFTIVLRKGYGLGAQAMAGGSFKAPIFTISWPTGEFGGMGLEGAVKLGYRKELEALEDPAERLALYEQMVERMYEYGKAVNVSSHFELDDVIDPMESRDWILRALRSVPPARRDGKKRPSIDTW